VNKQDLLQYIFDRYFSWRLEKFTAPEYLISLEYPINPIPRYGYGKPSHPELTKIIEAGKARYEQYLSRFLEYTDDLIQIPEKPSHPNTTAPVWLNDYFSALDAVALYGFLCVKNPQTYLEIGSGYSTRFARRAINEHVLQTKIISIDPYPRAEIDSICDRVIREPAEELDLKIFDDLQSGDILFIDSSHRCFSNSDVAVAFLDILPRLRKGVVVHIHDIFLPYDYPPSWAIRHYSEQYLLAACLLDEGGKIDILLPNAFVSMNEELSTIMQPLWDQPQLQRAHKHYCDLTEGFSGVSFWFETK
jgi:Methyltransferase domain